MPRNKSKWGVRKCWISKIGQVASDARIIELQRSKFDGSVKGKRSIKTSSGQFSRSICSAWEIFPTQPPVCDGDDGFSTELLRQRIREDCMGNLSEKEIDKIISKALTEWRQETIKAGGNAVVPQVVLQIFKAIEKYQLLYV
ncbi:hypothetical protein ACFFJX_12520 [Pseudarcicella hirudinis]|uniref:hypothetical protein n=1 Tax=Pseudarcicella hirudinis TaxID=1079859 RepID=UPI0035EC97AB